MDQYFCKIWFWSFVPGTLGAEDLYPDGNSAAAWEGWKVIYSLALGSAVMFCFAVRDRTLFSRIKTRVAI